MIFKCNLVSSEAWSYLMKISGLIAWEPSINRCSMLYPRFISISKSGDDSGLNDKLARLNLLRATLRSSRHAPMNNWTGRYASYMLKHDTKPKSLPNCLILQMIQRIPVSGRIGRSAAQSSSLASRMPLCLGIVEVYCDLDSEGYHAWIVSVSCSSHVN